EGKSTVALPSFTAWFVNCSVSLAFSLLFPSGRIAYWANGRLNESQWKTSAVGLARKYNLPILPIHMTARNSGLFYWLAKWSTELRDMTVFH
ncbi:GNAT family N-acetyltransferase, partial [Rhizobium johnstonii]|uniref:GNAT family N-acetyltransferase n=1 Tax=Rhizobium johnstonii TaxID=3019933 RepID=UPI003F9D7393